MNKSKFFDYNNTYSLNNITDDSLSNNKTKRPINQLTLNSNDRNKLNLHNLFNNTLNVYKSKIRREKNFDNNLLMKPKMVNTIEKKKIYLTNLYRKIAKPRYYNLNNIYSNNKTERIKNINATNIFW